MFRLSSPTFFRTLSRLSLPLGSELPADSPTPPKRRLSLPLGSELPADSPTPPKRRLSLPLGSE
ncbi:hypothetical protein, partial [Arcanobacterium phocae]|uniref:hypothetical protein n=1 Tax=Arcanobacterium phocae TaxID=131112 RepID=UPI001C10B9A2